MCAPPNDFVRSPLMGKPENVRTGGAICVRPALERPSRRGWFAPRFAPPTRAKQAANPPRLHASSSLIDLHGGALGMARAAWLSFNSRNGKNRQASKDAKSQRSRAGTDTSRFVTIWRGGTSLASRRIHRFLPLKRVTSVTAFAAHMADWMAPPAPMTAPRRHPQTNETIE